MTGIAKPGPPTPHDSLFRRVLGEPVNAASELRAVLPPTLVDRLDLGRLTPVPGSFVDEELRQRHSDLLFTAPLDGQQEAFIYVLIEHQSRADTMMAFRMLFYVARMLDRHLRENPGLDLMPPVFPIVLHHDRTPWTTPVQTLDLINLPPDLIDTMRRYQPQLEFVLDDLARVDERALRARPLTPVALLTLYLLRTAKDNRHLTNDLEPYSDDLRWTWTNTDHFPALMTYIHTVGETPPDELRKFFANLGTDAEEAYVTTAEMLRAEGEARGRAEGEAHGRAEGEAHGRAEALVQLLTLRFGSLPQHALDTVHAATTDQLAAWTARVLTADTLDQVVG